MGCCARTVFCIITLQSALRLVHSARARKCSSLLHRHTVCVTVVGAAGDHLAPGAFVEIQLMTTEPRLASGRVVEVYDASPGQQPVVALHSGEIGAVRAHMGRQAVHNTLCNPLHQKCCPALWFTRPHSV